MKSEDISPPKTSPGAASGVWATALVAESVAALIELTDVTF
jgi:hypothetical protein